MASFLTPKFHVLKFGEEERELRFYPTSVRMAFKLRALSDSVTKALRILFDRNDSDVGITTRQINNGESSESVVEAITPELAKLRSDEKDKALGNLAMTFLDPSNGRLLAELIMDSLREEEDFSRPAKKSEIDAFLDNLDVASMAQLLTGLAAGNAAVFGPLGERLVGTVGAMLEGKVAEVAVEPSNSASSATPPTSGT